MLILRASVSASHGKRSSEQIQQLLKRRRRPVALVSGARVVADLQRLTGLFVSPYQTRRRQRQRTAVLRHRLHLTVDGVLGDGNTMLVRRRAGTQRRSVARISAAAVALRRRLADGTS